MGGANLKSVQFSICGGVKFIQPESSEFSYKSSVEIHISSFCHCLGASDISLLLCGK